MSLINKMLRDLDERQASSLERGGLAAQVRALPREKRFPWASVLPIAVGTVIGAAGIWLALDASPSSPGANPQTVAQVAAAPPSPAVALALPTLVVPMPTEPVEKTGEAAGAVVADSGGSPAPESLQMDLKLSHAAARVASAPVAPPASAGLPAQIDKRVRVQAADTADGEYRKALAAYRQGRANEAAEGFLAALRLDARHVSARQALLSLLLEQRRWQEAQAVAADGLALLPAQPGWAMILARLQVEQGQLADAERTMAAHAAYAERNGDYLAFQGLLLERLQRPQEARAAFLKARDAGNLPPETAAAIEQRLR